jgi:hypothetical protein
MGAWIRKPGDKTVHVARIERRKASAQRANHKCPRMSGPGPLGAQRKSERCDGREQTGV